VLAPDAPVVEVLDPDVVLVDGIDEERGGDDELDVDEEG
jgi:hypothetical protein